MASTFETLNGINVNEHTEKKDTDNGRTQLTYLSWPWAWAEVKKRYPDAQYTVVKDAAGLPYFSDPRTGIMVYTTVTIDGITHEMWLPVMDSKNKAMRFEQYEIATKHSTTTVKPATMFDINKTIMRCLTKNLAMFGLGLYIYAGEDLPESDDEKPQDDKQKKASKPKYDNSVQSAEEKQTEMEKARAAVTCERCGNIVKSVKLGNGSMFTSQQIIEQGHKDFGGCYCYRCQFEMKANKEMATA